MRTSAARTCVCVWASCSGAKICRVVYSGSEDPILKTPFTIQWLIAIPPTAATAFFGGSLTQQTHLLGYVLN